MPKLYLTHNSLINCMNLKFPTSEEINNHQAQSNPSPSSLGGNCRTCERFKISLIEFAICRLSVDSSQPKLPVKNLLPTNFHWSKEEGKCLYAFANSLVSVTLKLTNKVLYSRRPDKKQRSAALTQQPASNQFVPDIHSLISALQTKNLGALHLNN